MAAAMAESMSACHTSQSDVGPLPRTSKSVSIRNQCLGSKQSGSVRECASLNTFDDFLMLQYCETILSTIMDHQISVDPLLANNIDEPGNELGTPRLREEIPPSLEEERSHQSKPMSGNPFFQKAIPPQTIACICNGSQISVIAMNTVHHECLSVQ
jgi:hypothetical protein